MSGCLPHDECRAPGSASEQTSGRASRRSQTAFSLLEVMIASGIFFMTVFAILAMVSSVLRNARSLRRVELDAGMVAAQACCLLYTSPSPRDRTRSRMPSSA